MAFSAPRPPLPPFNAKSAADKARKAEDAWNSRNPAEVALAYTDDSQWRNRSEFLQGRSEIIAFLSRKWQRELDYRLIKEVWAYEADRIASINDIQISATERRFHWPLGRRPDDHPGLSDLGW